MKNKEMIVYPDVILDLTDLNKTVEQAIAECEVTRNVITTAVNEVKAEGFFKRAWKNLGRAICPDCSKAA